MSENAKKGLIISLIILLLVGIAFLIYWGVTNYEKVQEGLNGTGLYTSIDLENAKKEGYLEGANSLQELEKQLQDLKAQLDTKTKSVTELTNRVTELTNANNELLENKSENEQIIIDKNLEIQSLNAQIAELNSKISRLNELLKAYQAYEGQTFEAVFYVDDEAVSAKVVKIGEVVTQDYIPTKTGNVKYTFKGWSIDRATIVNLGSYQITENTNFYAVFEESYYSILEFDENSDIRTYSISTPEELNKFSELSQTLTFNGYTILQTANIEMQNVEYTPISISDNNFFEGTYNGNNYEIRNLTSIRSDARNAFIGRANCATLINIRLVNINITTNNGQGNTAGLVAYYVGSPITDDVVERSVIDNIYISGNIFGDMTVGGLIGNAFAYYVNVTNITLNCNVKCEPTTNYASTYSYVGSVFGRLGYADTILENINFNGSLTINGDVCYSGVIVGFLSGGDYSLTLNQFNINVDVQGNNELDIFADTKNNIKGANCYFSNGTISYSGNVLTQVPSELVYSNVTFNVKN